MSNRLNVKLLGGVVVASALVYGGVIFLTSQLTESKEFAEHAKDEKTDAEQTVSVSPETRLLEQKLQAEPDNKKLMSDLAAAYSREAAATRNVGLLIRAVDLYQSILKTDPKNADASLSLALIMMDIGGYDRAVELFQEYLTIKPEDVRVRGDYALALIQAERLDDAEKQLQQIINSKQYLVQSYLSRALIMKLRGSSDRVLAELDIAAKHAENDLDREKISGFRAMLKSEASAEAASVKAGSPAETLDQFFKSHPIVGPKLKGIRWPAEKRAEVLLKDFPVEQMPPFAKAKFVSSVTAVLKSMGDGFSVVLLDADSSKELMHIPETETAPAQGAK